MKQENKVELDFTDIYELKECKEWFKGLKLKNTDNYVVLSEITKGKKIIKEQVDKCLLKKVCITRSENFLAIPITLNKVYDIIGQGKAVTRTLESELNSLI